MKKLWFPNGRFGQLGADDGQTLVLTALALMMLMLVAALGIDVGYLKYEKEQMQKAADAGAIAAATALSYHGDYLDAGLNDVASNGFQNGVNSVTVAINNPPAAGDLFAGNANYVQVIVSKPIPTFFMKFADLASVNVSSRAVANAAASASGCIYALDPIDSGTFLIDGNVNLAATCGIYVESNSQTALLKHGNSGSVDVNAPGAGIGVVGNYSGTGFTPTPTTGIPPFTDPLGSVPTPTYNANCKPPITNTQLTSGTYCGGINLSGNGAYTLGPGTYVLLGGGLTMSGTTSISGSGVMFYVTGNGTYQYSGVHLGGSNVANLSAQTTGTYAGILFFQDRSIPTNASPSSFDGTNSSSFTGAIYFPTTTVQYKGTPGLGTYSPIVAWELEFKGDATIKDNFLNGGSPIPGATLVE